jgi:hypothetical protein
MDAGSTSIQMPTQSDLRTRSPLTKKRMNELPLGHMGPGELI